MPDVYDSELSKLKLEEALQHLSQTRETGCLLVGNHLHLCQIFVKDGYAVCINFNDQSGEASLNIPSILNANHAWLAGETASSETLRLPLMGLALKMAVGRDEEKFRLSSQLSSLEKSDLKDTRSFYLMGDNDPSLRFELIQTGTVAGCNACCDIVINDRSVSGRHCLFDLHKRGLFLRDLKSENGTFVNGVLLYEGQYVQVGDVINLGNVRLKLFKSKK